MGKETSRRRRVNNKSWLPRRRGRASTEARTGALAVTCKTYGAKPRPYRKSRAVTRCARPLPSRSPPYRRGLHNATEGSKFWGPGLNQSCITGQPHRLSNARRDFATAITRGEGQHASGSGPSSLTSRHSATPTSRNVSCPSPLA